MTNEMELIDMPANMQAIIQSQYGYGYTRKAKTYNKKLEIKKYLKSFKIPFDMADDAMDLRTMAENYDHGIVPLEDIHQGLRVLAGQPQAVIINLYDPSTDSLSPKFAYVDWTDLYLMPIFQRDVMHNHIKKILKSFEHSCIIVPCAIKITIDGRTIYAIWDGHHTVQVCRFNGYTKFPIWYIDVDGVTDDQLVAKGFSTDVDGRIGYGIYRAGTNMRDINNKNKAQLSAYDDYMIGVETGDPDLRAIQNIYNKYNVVPRRKPQNQGGSITITQHKTAQECYYLQTSNGDYGVFLDRALNFHTKTWRSPITMEVFRPMAYLYKEAALQGIQLDSQFDKEFGDLLKQLYNDSESVQLKIKESFHNTALTGGGVGIVPDKDKDRVLNGFINLYVQHINRLPVFITPEFKWKV